MVTGEFDGVMRSKIEEIIIGFGGRYVSGMSSKVDILVVGRVLSDGRPSEESKKYQDALKMKKKILKEGEFEEFLQEKSQNLEFTLSGKPSVKKAVQAPSKAPKVSAASSGM